MYLGRISKQKQKFKINLNLCVGRAESIRLHFMNFESDTIKISEGSFLHVIRFCFSKL